MYWWAPPFYLHPCNCDWLEPYHVVQWKWSLYTTLYGRCHLVSGGQSYVWLAEPYHVVPFDSMLLHFFVHNTDANMLLGLFDNCNYMDIYLPIHQEYSYLGKQKISSYFSTSTCEHLWPSPSHLVNCAKCSHNPSKDAADWSVVADFKSLLNFNFLLLKIWFSQTSPFVDMYVDMIILRWF